MMGRAGGWSATLLRRAGGHTERQEPRLACQALAGSGASPPGSEARVRGPGPPLPDREALERIIRFLAASVPPTCKMG